MITSLSTAATGMKAQQLNVDVISNNIANLTTTAFKRQRAEFQDLIYQDKLRPGTSSSDTGTIIPAGIQIGLGVNAGAVYRINEQGSLQQTDNEFDMAINGRGFFQVELPSGEIAYTRAGSFQPNADGQIVTPQGYVVSPGITIPADATDITINESGQVSVKLDGTVDPQVVGQFSLVTFINPTGLSAQGNNLFLETDASGQPQEGFPNTPGFGRIQQKFVEASNVDVVTEITNLITAQRAYEQNSRVITTSDQMLQTVFQIQ